MFQYKYWSEYLSCGLASMGADGSWITGLLYNVSLWPKSPEGRAARPYRLFGCNRVSSGVTWL